jgi:hypothetical protein
VRAPQGGRGAAGEGGGVLREEEKTLARSKPAQAARGRSCGQTREPAPAGEPLSQSAGEPGRWRALCWEKRAVGLTGNAPDQVPDQ